MCRSLRYGTLIFREFRRTNEGITKLVEDNNAEEERKSRTAEFELRAKNMGITGEKFVTQKVAIWEGMWAAKQNGDGIGVSIIFRPYLEVIVGLLLIDMGR